MPEDLRRFQVPITPIPLPQPVPQDLADEQPPVEERKPGWQWVGSDQRPEAGEYSDGISDLFTVDDEDLDAGEGVDDLVEVDMERDIIDADEDGSLDDLVDVTWDDVMGNEYGQRPSKQTRPQPRRRTRRYNERPTSLGGMRG